MREYIHYDDISKDELKVIKRSIYAEKDIKTWNALIVILSNIIALSVSIPYLFNIDIKSPYDIVITVFIYIIIMVGLICCFYESIIKPKIIKRVEIILNKR